MGKNGRIFYLSWNFLKNLVRFVPPLVSTKLDLDLEQLSQNRLVLRVTKQLSSHFLGKSCHVKKITPCKICVNLNTYSRK